MRRKRDPESMAIIREAADKGTILEVSIVRLPGDVARVNIFKESIPISAPWQLPVEGSPPFGQMRKIQIKRFVRRYRNRKSGRIDVYEFFLAVPAEPKNLPKGEYDLASQRYFRTVLEIGRKGSPIIRNKGIIFKPDNMTQMKQLEWWKYVGQEIEVSALIGMSSGVFYPRYANLGMTQRLTIKEDIDKLQGMIHLVDIDGKRLRIPAVTIFNIHIDDILDKKKVESIWKECIKSVQTSDSDPIELEGKILARKEEVMKCLHSAKKCLIDLLGNKSTSFRMLTNFPSDFNDEEMDIEEVADMISGIIGSQIEDEEDEDDNLDELAKQMAENTLEITIDKVICALEGCENPVSRKGGKYCCLRHYQEHRKQKK